MLRGERGQIAPPLKLHEDQGMLGSFLDRMIPSGNFLAVTARAANGNLFNKFLPRVNFDDAARFCIAMSGRGRDTWYAMASYRDATLQDDGSYRGRRTQANVESLKSFWFDADIARPGDGKDPAKVFANHFDVVVWVKSFSQQTGIPLPNVWVRSGYGVHLYWTFADPISRAEWQPHADALKASLIGAKGDTSVIGDAARILRPPGTMNFKEPTAPAPVAVMIDQPDYANLDLLPKLLPTTGSSKPPKAMKATSLAANAKAGLTAQPREFAVIAQQCAQLRQSANEGGQNDGRQMWRAWLTLARFCTDGREWAHKVGELHATYNEADTEAECDLIEKEYQAKQFGAPLCASIEAERPGGCDGCPLKGQGKSPFALGIPPQTNPDELPNGYRRGGTGFIEMYHDKQWQPILAGDVTLPTVENLGTEYRLTFNYTESNGKVIRRVIVTSSELLIRTTIAVTLARQGMAINDTNRTIVPRFLMGWIDQLVRACEFRAALPAFGWLHTPDFNGFATGGMFYNADGTTHPTTGVIADEHLLNAYTPTGSLDAWRDAAAFIIGQIPELHLAVSLSFGAMLMELAGDTGGCIAFVGESGAGKSSAFKAGAAVWGHPVNTLMQLNDTVNYKMQVLGQTRALPLYWDEALLGRKDSYEKLFELLHMLTQGRDKGRLTAEIRTREHGTWQTIYALASNRSVSELIAAQHTHKSATLLRVLEVTLRHKLPAMPDSEARIAPLMRNYGHAGALFAQYVATHQTQIKQVIEAAGEAVIQALGSYEANERFYLGVSRACIAGAAVAKKIGLLPTLDVAGILDVLVSTIRASRQERDEIEPSEQFDLHKVLEQFLNDNSDGLLITGEFKKTGPQTLSQNLVQYPRPTGMPRAIPCVQIAVEQKRMRVDKDVMRNWLTAEGKSARSVFEAMVVQWGATGVNSKMHTRLGAGERWSTPGRVNVIELDLDQRELRYMLDDYATTGSPVVGGNVVAMPPPRPRKAADPQTVV